ncbi:MAG: DUF4397 domain-containing protein [Bacteroidetes bacterium]|nr:MAG: DUF4397 domain-containing protein [Bacteroidota bacterium]
MKINFYFLFLIPFFLLVSCECVPDINTPKVIIPTDFGNVKFINAITDMDSVDLCAGDEIISIKNMYDSADVRYKEIASGLASIRVQSSEDSAIYYNTMVELKKDAYYTFIAYGTKSRTNGLLLRDSIENPVPSNAYVRFIHLSPDSPEIIYSLGNLLFNQSVKYKSHTSFLPIPTGSFSLIIKDSGNGNEIKKIDNYDFKPGKFYDLILKGYYIQPNTKELTCQVIEFSK